MQLHSATYGDEHKPALILIHGMFGSGRMWRSFATQFAEYFWVHAPDLRNHGKSAHVESMSLQQMAADIKEYMDAHNIHSALILGHSLGGKVAMQVALDYPDMVERLLLEDIAPVFYAPRHDDVFAGIRAIGNSQIKTRAEAEAVSANIIKDKILRQFLFTNLATGADGCLHWTNNMQALEDNYAAISEPPRGVHSVFEKPVLFIRGGQSFYVLDQYRPAIKAMFPLARIATIKSAGHFLHNQDPDSFMRISMGFLKPYYLS